MELLLAILLVLMLPGILTFLPLSESEREH